MNIRTHAALIITGFLTGISFCTLHAQTGVDLLENGGFEYATTGLSDGNNVGVVPPGWTVSAGQANWQQGQAGGAINLQPYNGPYSGGSISTQYNNESDIVGSHFFDGTNDNSAGYTILSQTFTLTRTSTNIVGSFALGVRDPGGNQAGTAANAANTSRIDILNSANVSVLTVYGDTLSTTNGWEVNPFSISNLPADTYTFQVSLYKFQNIDAIALVPEPSTWVAVLGGMGILTLVQVARHRAAASGRC